MSDAAAPVDWTGEKKISLALQGGGSHGAFTWGVLDAILEDGRLDVEAITGTSAGAMNAVVFAEGYLEGGRAGARQSLARFWRSISDEGAFSPEQQKFVHLFFRDWPLQSSLAYWWADFFTHYSSPYDFNPLNINPLRDHLVKMIDFEKVRACEELKLFVSATNVHTGRIAVFERSELTADHVMASACLPFLFQAVEIFAYGAEGRPEGCHSVIPYGSPTVVRPTSKTEGLLPGSSWRVTCPMREIEAKMVAKARLAGHAQKHTDSVTFSRAS